MIPRDNKPLVIGIDAHNSTVDPHAETVNLTGAQADVLIASAIPPISEHGNVGGVQRMRDGSYRWWWSGLMAVHVRTKTDRDFQAIPSWALRQIADDMDARANGGAA